MGSQKSFLQLSRKECLDVYKEILENSERHFRCARILSRNFEYGNAISHLVLGTEELVKALIIVFDGFGLELRKVKSVKLLFSNHKSRHLFSSMFVLMAYSMKSTFRLIEKHRRSNFADIPNFSEENVISFWKNEGNAYFLRIEKDLIFWEDADSSKMRGFYVDFNGQLLTPKHILKEDFRQALKATNYFRKECLDIIGSSIELSANDLKKMITTLNVASFYNQKEAFITGKPVV